MADLYAAFHGSCVSSDNVYNYDVGRNRFNGVFTDVVTVVQTQKVVNSRGWSCPGIIIYAVNNYNAACTDISLWRDSSHVGIIHPSSNSTSLAQVRRTVEPSGDLPPLGLIKSSLAIDLSKYFEFEAGEDEPPTHFYWQGRRHTLTNELILMAEKYSKEETE